VTGALWILSDLHIVRPDDETAVRLIHFLTKTPQADDHVVFAGDLFDAFSGEKNYLQQRFRPVLDAILSAHRRGVYFHIIEGNHDFHWSGWDGANQAVRLHEPGLTLHCGGRKIWVEHGDLINQKDWGYLLLRATFRSPAVRTLFRWAPDAWLDEFGKQASQGSRSAHPWLPENLPQQRLSDLRSIYRSAANQKILGGMDFVVFGHCHDLDEVRFQVGPRPVQYINMGFPPVHGTILRYQPGATWIERVCWGESSLR
jgi:UDP-2,3-diacylglucosamine hydrolase